MSRAAYEKAGLGPRDVDVIQLQDTDAGAEVYHMAENGFCADGDQEQLLAEGATEIGGRLPVNTDGGLIANGEPIGASGLRQVHELVLQLRGDRRGTPGSRALPGSATRSSTAPPEPRASPSSPRDHPPPPRASGPVFPAHRPRASGPVFPTHRPRASGPVFPARHPHPPAQNHRSTASMLLDLTSDQQFFRETTAKFLADQVPAELLQQMAGTVPADWEAGYWRRGAELGWTSLLVSEEAGGGSISGRGVDLSVIAHEFGRRAAPGPLLPANVVAATLSDAGTHPEALAALLAGTAVAAWCHSEPRSSAGSRGAAGNRGAADDVTLDIRADGGDLVLNGVKRPVEAAAQAQYLLVTGRAGGPGGRTQVLVPAGTPGITITPLHTADYSRHFATVTFTDVRVPASAVVGEAGAAAEQVERQLQIALVTQNAESVGAMQTAFDMTVAWAFDRYSFGRPLASYQELKHRFADMFTWLQASHAINDAAAAAVEPRRAGGRRTRERRQGLHRRISARSCCRTACRCTAVSA